MQKYYKNLALTNGTYLPFVKCASIRFKIAWKEIFCKDEDVFFALIYSLHSFNTSFFRKALKTHHFYLADAQCHSFDFKFCENIFLLSYQRFFSLLESNKLDDVMLIFGTYSCVKYFLEKLINIESLALRVQSSSTAMSNCFFFWCENLQLLWYEYFSFYNTQNLHYRKLESAVVKIQKGNTRSTTRKDRFLQKDVKFFTSIVLLVSLTKVQTCHRSSVLWAVALLELIQMRVRILTYFTAII